MNEQHVDELFHVVAVVDVSDDENAPVLNERKLKAAN